MVQRALLIFLWFNPYPPAIQPKSTRRLTLILLTLDPDLLALKLYFHHGDTCIPFRPAVKPYSNRFKPVTEETVWVETVLDETVSDETVSDEAVSDETAVG